ncbi:conserved hypothetical protein [Neospora caninum Liverpool]|uniref:Large ribosomal subunit protein mL54 n=1 Tax=Neospora caninum (strain Liverpool) TaxID=572307 RepID=F0VFL0_NEOCL|nr:conserved hypothetical protein [Neospora caninum Liverpool]CBZ52504.1 conserved hypothetical protein [Neospora caninum Liverpool]|eukprot:XP_003882536.1 conserved hypothetical protein [Neospora caninum Liverpool]
MATLKPPAARVRPPGWSVVSRKSSSLGNYGKGFFSKPLCGINFSAQNLARSARRLRLSPKKRGAAASAAAQHAKGPGTASGSGAAGVDHIFNIFKDVPVDHKILDDNEYPAWLFTLDKPEKTYGELAMTFLYGVGIETATLDDYLRFTRLHTKNLIKLNNMRLKKSKRSSVKPLFWDV